MVSTSHRCRWSVFLLSSSACLHFYFFFILCPFLSRSPLLFLILAFLVLNTQYLGICDWPSGCSTTIYLGLVVWHLQYTALASGLLWWLGYWLESTDVIAQCLWRQSGWPHLETFFSPHSPTLLFISRPPPIQSSVSYCSLLTSPYNPNLRDQIRNTNTKHSTG